MCFPLQIDGSFRHGFEALWLQDKKCPFYMLYQGHQYNLKGQAKSVNQEKMEEVWNHNVVCFFLLLFFFRIYQSQKKVSTVSREGEGKPYHTHSPIQLRVPFTSSAYQQLGHTLQNSCLRQTFGCCQQPRLVDISVASLLD